MMTLTIPFAGIMSLVQFYLLELVKYKVQFL